MLRTMNHRSYGGSMKILGSAKTNGIKALNFQPKLGQFTHKLKRSGRARPFESPLDEADRDYWKTGSYWNLP